LRYLKLGDEVVIFGNVFGIVEGNDHPTSYAISIRSLQKIIENYPYNTVLQNSHHWNKRLQITIF
jgi:hypothetical protein